MFLLAFLLIVSLTAAFAQAGMSTEDYAAAYETGKLDATTDVSAPMWIGVGCVTGGFSWLYPEIFPSNAVPQAKVIGKSASYVGGYTDGYAKTRKQIIQKNSCIGGGVYWGCCIVYYVAAVAAAASE